MATKKLTKKQLIIDHLKKHGNITSMQSIDLYGHTRLSGLIFLLKKEGWDIVSEECKGLDRLQNECSWSKYIVISEPKEGALQKKVEAKIKEKAKPKKGTVVVREHIRRVEKQMPKYTRQDYLF